MSGAGGHNSKQGTSVFLEAMRWLWQAGLAPVKKMPAGMQPGYLTIR